jgi:hypothetical protein
MNCTECVIDNRDGDGELYEGLKWEDGLITFKRDEHDRPIPIQREFTWMSRAETAPRPIASDRQDCETSAGMEEARTIARALIAEMEQPASRLDYRPTLSGEVPSSVEELMDPRSA